MFYFGTCNRRKALEFLRSIYEDESIADEGPTKDLLDLVEADIVRVQDPMMHSPAAIMPSTNFVEPMRDSLTATCKAFHEHVLKSCDASEEG